MHPVLFSIGQLSISSFGAFLALAFLATIFIIWRLSKAYDLNEEKIIDLVILVFFGGMVGARLYFVILNLNFFDNFNKVILINRYPGLSFWGGLVGGFLTLWFFSKRSRLNFWQIADFASISFLLGVVLGDIGCFLGGCFYGVVSDSALATPVAGLIGKRLPIALIESFLLLLAFFYLWKQVVRFHFAGKIVANSLIVLGIIKFYTEFYRGDVRPLIPYVGLSYGQLFAILGFAVGIYIFYRQSKRKLASDAKSLVNLLSSAKKRQLLLLRSRKTWYNYQVDFKIKMDRGLQALRSLPKVLKRRLNVKSTPNNLN